MKKLSLILNLLLLANILSLSAQPRVYRIDYTLHGLKDTLAWLCDVKGKEVYAIDSVKISSGNVSFEITDSQPHGVYKIVFNDTLFTDIIFGGEDIVLESMLPDIIGKMKVHSSVENRLLFGYWQFYFRVHDTLDDVIRQGRELYYASQGKPSRALDDLQKRADQLEQQKIDYILRMMNDYPDHFAPKLVWSFQHPDYRYYLMNGGNPYPSEKEYYQNHFFDKLDFSDTRMLNTEVLFVMINDYLKTFGQPATSENYIGNISFILDKAKVNPTVYQYCLELFLSNFEITIWEPVFLYLVEEHYLKSSLSNPALKQAYRKRAQAVRNTSIGQKVPDVCGTTPTGKQHCLLDELGTRTLLVLWSHGCDHCEAILPELAKVNREYSEKGFKIFAFTLSEDRDSLAASMKHFGIDWINISDYKGFNSEVVDRFNISVTPVMYLLDSNGVITDRPSSIPVLYANLVVRYRDDQ